MRATWLLTLFLIVCSPTASRAQWVAQVLGPLEGRSTVATAINAGGDVVGYSWNERGSQIPFVWTSQTGYRAFPGDAEGWATDINNRGDIVG